jgi:hypothetical protein
MSKRFLIHSASQNLLLVAACMTLFCSVAFPITGFAGEQKEKQNLYDSKGKRDPFVPLVRDGRIVGVGAEPISTGGSTPLLAGIVWDPHGRSIALINDTEVMVGDRVGDYQVTEIREDAVVLVRNGESLVLQITFDQPAPQKKSSD